MRSVTPTRPLGRFNNDAPVRSGELERYGKLPHPPDYSHLHHGKLLLEVLAKQGSDASRRRLTWILDDLALPEGGRVLEVGCGCGAFAMELGRRGYDYTGFDIIQECADMWQLLKADYGFKGEIHQQDFCDSDSTEQYDGILARHTFEHFHDREAAFRNAFRMLKPGGRLVIIDGNVFDPHLVTQMLFLRPDGGLLWPFKKRNVVDDYGMGWKGKAEDVKSIYWWRRNLAKRGFQPLRVTTTASGFPWARRLGLWRFSGSIYAVAQKPAA